MMRHSLLIIPIAAAVLSGCATHKMGNVIPGENNLYQVISTGKSADAALASALYSAETTCRQRQLRHIVLDHKTEYKGMISAGAAETVEKVLEMILNEPDKKTPVVADENDYRTTMQFRCE